MRSASSICSTRWMPVMVIWLGTMSLIEVALFLRQFLEQLLHLRIGQKLGHVRLEDFGEMGGQHGRRIDDGVALDRRFLLERGVDPGRRQAEGRLGGVDAGKLSPGRRPGP